MQSGWNIEALVPINDAAEAAFMAIKAECLCRAGIINQQEKQWVDARVRASLNYAGLKDAA
jgi:hypothetical protein